MNEPISQWNEPAVDGAAFPRSGRDQALLSRLQRDDETAFEELVRDNGGRMLSSARRLVRSEEDAQDVVQEAFLLAFRSLPTFEGRAMLSTWLHRIVINVALMRLRSRKRRPEALIDDLLPSFSADGHRILEAHDEVELSADLALSRECDRRLVRSCIDRLPESHRIVLLLRDIEDLTTDEAAGVLGIQPGTVKVRLHRARQALKTLLQKEMMTIDDAA
jgi:RNA polymerase sigma-70 factor, ECF subfamily